MMFYLAQIRRKLVDFEKSGFENYLQSILCQICAILSEKQPEIDTTIQKQIKGEHFWGSMTYGVI